MRKSCPTVIFKIKEQPYLYPMADIDPKYIRKIIHIDMDAFFASVAQRDHPELRGKPVAVGGDGIRGVVAAASYEARAYGVRSAMPAVSAKKRCPHLIFVKHDFDTYKEVSAQIREIFFEYTDLVEPLSLDEAFLDVTENKKGIETATRIAKAIRKDIFNQTGLTASAGISINKFLAKVASDINKPNGQKTIMPEEALLFLEQLPVRKFFGVGEKTAEKMHALGIFNGRDLLAHDLAFLRRNFGKAGHHFYDIVRGIQHSQVQPNRIRKSIGAEHTFSENISDLPALEKALESVFDRLRPRISHPGRTVTLKIKHEDFTVKTISYTMEQATDTPDDIKKIAFQLLRQNPPSLSVRLLGITLSNLETEPEQPQAQVIQLTLQF
jgi:DNA polymerase-4